MHAAINKLNRHYTPVADDISVDCCCLRNFMVDSIYLLFFSNFSVGRLVKTIGVLAHSITDMCYIAQDNPKELVYIQIIDLFSLHCLVMKSTVFKIFVK